MQKNDIDDRLKVRFDLDNVPLVKEETKSTYGIIERECYNKSKYDYSRQPKCSREKEEMIVDALKHLKML